MARYARGFILASSATTHRLFQEAIRSAELLERRSPGTAAVTITQLTAAYGRWQLELERIAVAAAKDADARMRQRLAATRKRPDTRVKPKLRDNLVSRPLPGAIEVGSVGVADVDRLDKVVNPLYPDYGPYWRAQEDGSRAAVGKRVKGYFYGGGYTTPDVPRAQYVGGRGPHPIFVTASRLPGRRGGSGGPGLIQHGVQPRHFIRDGAAAAAADWRAALRANEREAIASIRSILRPGASPAVRRRRTPRRRRRLR